MGGRSLRAQWGARGIVLVWLTAVPGLVLAQASVAPGRPVPAAPRVSAALDHGWRFKQSDELTGVENRGFDDSGWTTVDIPHTWNRDGNQGLERM
jgi:beta-galactosidase